MNKSNIKIKIIIGTIIFVCVAILVEINILATVNKRQISKTSSIILDQMDNILNNNAQNEKDIIDELKIEYVDKANTVAYILEYDEEAIDDSAELVRIAQMMGIDEINLFSDEGVIFNGTHPNYFGLTLDSGEQISFFKPMLDDKNLTMCQDVMPNTAEEKSMMYAITWDNTKTYMIQVGIEPVRLLKFLKNNNIHEVVDKLPVYDGMNIYVADMNTGEIIGTTDKDLAGSTIYDTGFLGNSDDIRTIRDKSMHLNGFRYYCQYRQHGDYIIAVIHSTAANLESLLLSLTIEVMWLMVSGTVIIYALLNLTNANKRIKSQMSILSSMSDIYYSIHLINMADFSIEKLEGNDLMDKVVSEGQNASDMLTRIVKTTVEDEYIESALKFTDLSTLSQRLKNTNSITMDAIDKNVGWLRMTFIKVDADKDNNTTQAIIATQVINDDKKREEELSNKANRDELTGLLNRRAYEDDLLNYPDVPPEKDFVFAAIDINGLKVVNDELGHVAGDELIRAASTCLKRTFGNYGRVYRTGGDEFVSMFFADEERTKDILMDLERITLDFTGEFISSVSLAVGLATKREFVSETVSDMAKIADSRMYKAKEEYYARKGVDRKGQAAAHTALCNLYTKILKINLTDDTYAIINMDEDERTPDKGFSDRISSWLLRFAETGQVHEDDIEEYSKKTNVEFLKQYFKGDKTSISIFYRRKYDSTYKQVVMEMIPANDYTNDNQSLFLYVKTIDK